MKRIKTKKNKEEVIVYHDFRRTIIFISFAIFILAARYGFAYHYNYRFEESVPDNLTLAVSLVSISLFGFSNTLQILYTSPVLNVEFDKHYSFKYINEVSNIVIYVLLCFCIMTDILYSAIIIFVGTCYQSVLDFFYPNVIPFNIKSLRKLIKTPQKYMVRGRYGNYQRLNLKELHLFLVLFGIIPGIIAISYMFYLW